ncbi:MAG: lipocalin [Pedobacter sp.]|nr:MAG: lipocalin [Pedobacter sp.]
MKNDNILKTIGFIGLLAGVALVLNSCKTVKVPSGINLVKPFNAKKYAGKWYEIARFDFKHEKNMKNVTAQYTLNEDGTIDVLNRGYEMDKERWNDAKGKAQFVDDPNEGALKVSFFGPFYAGYNVVQLEGDYEYALVFGENKDYIWILSRTKTLPADVKAKFLKIAGDYGYDLSRLIWTQHDN